MKPLIVGATFARGGSKGVPRKNLRDVAGKPLIAWAIDIARATPSIDRVIVSTDDDEIAATARRYGAEVPFMRPAELARDDSPEWLAWQHAIRTLDSLSPERPVGVLVSVPATSPLRAVEDVESCIRLLCESDADLVVTATPARRNPYFNMVHIDDGYARLLNAPDGRRYFRRQDAPPMFDLTTVAYAARASFVLNSSSWFDGKVKVVVVPDERGLDIDTELDLKMAELLLRGSPAT